MACMVCRKYDVLLLSVGQNYGTINHTVGDDLVEIYGEKVSFHLTPESCVCNTCMNMLENIAKLIRNIWSLISNPCDQPTPDKLGKLWKIFASLKVDCDDIEEECQSSLNRTPTPSKLVTLVFSEPYQSTQEDKFAEKERQRSLSRASSHFARSEVSSTYSEVREIVKPRRKRKGHNWTRPKRGRSRTNYSRPSTDISRLTSPVSNYSSMSCRSYRKSPSRKKKVVEYDDKGRLTKKRTRSVSRAQEEEEKIKFYCKEYQCQLYFHDVEVLNYHQITDHRLPALHYCDECQQRYTKAELLRTHVGLHDTSPLYCLMCAMEVKNRNELQDHLDEHMVYSIPCKYCDKSFLSKGIMEEHIKKCHRGRKKRDSHNRTMIIDRIDSGYSESEKTEEKVQDKGDYLEVIMMTYAENMSVESGDLDVTEETLRLQNAEIWSNENEENEREEMADEAIENEEIVGEELENEEIVGEEIENEENRLNHSTESELIVENI